MTSFASARCRATWPSIGVALFVVAGVAAVVAAVGTAPRHGESAAAAALPASASAEQIAAMVARLAERLRHDPDDVAAWALLARSQVTLGHHAEAVTAYRRASGLRPDDAGLLADFAYALAMANRRNWHGEPQQLIERALAIDPEHPKALALAGTAAFAQHDYAGALRHWEKLARSQPADSVFARQVQPSIAEARRLGGIKTPS